MAGGGPPGEDEATTKKPSKKELKKLAKKAEEEAQKKAGAAGAGAGGAGKEGGASAAVEGGRSRRPQPKPVAYFLANASLDDPASLKVSVASRLYDVTIHRAPSAVRNAFPFAHGPVLTTDPTGGGGEVIFGGNAIAKALGLLGSGVDPSFDPRVDEWLEFERTKLRPALSSSSSGGDEKKKTEAALSKLEESLSLHGGMHLVEGRTTIADVCVVVTLHELSDASTLPPAVKKYVLGHIHAPAFREGYAALPSLVQPPPFAYGDDPSLLKAVEGVFEIAIAKAFPESAALDVPTSVQRCSKPKLADFQCNASMVLFKKLKDSGGLPESVRTPQDVARAVVASIPKDNPAIDSLDVNGPGFVLCKIKSSYLQGFLNDLSSSGEPRKPTNLRPRKCVVDFSSPNIAKEMHVGHLRSTIIGESVCRILEYGGCDVERVNHVGDWGTQFGMLIQYLREEYPDFVEEGRGGGGGGEGANITDLTAFYKSAKNRFDESPEFKKSAQSNVVSLQSGDESCLKMWKALCDVSRREFQKVYDRLDVTVSECGESFYNDKIPAVIEEFEEKNMIRVEEGGAKCVFVDGFRVPLMLQKSDGGYGYDSTDMAALKHRLQVLHAERIVVVTDSGQGDHFKMCNAAADAIGWVDPSVHDLVHIGFGTVQGEDGKRFKTRSGDVVRLVDLLDEAVERMEQSLAERIREKKANITVDEVHETASALGYGAVKYFDLRRNPTTNYAFSYDRMLDTRGNTAIYLLYAHARLASICAKGRSDHDIDVETLASSGSDAEIVLDHPSERNLALHLSLFADAIETTLEDLYPYHVCEFLYNASIAASDFVTQCKVLGSPEMKSRLLLCRATTIVMRKCFDLLGIRCVMRI